MRRNRTNNPREAKLLAQQKYAERQIDKWVKWSWETKGIIRYRDLVKLQTRYGIVST